MNKRIQFFLLYVLVEICLIISSVNSEALEQNEPLTILSYLYLNGGSFSGPAIAESPDPLIKYQ